jgi:hypothetical protein
MSEGGWLPGSFSQMTSLQLFTKIDLHNIVQIYFVTACFTSCCEKLPGSSWLFF